MTSKNRTSEPDPLGVGSLSEFSTGPAQDGDEGLGNDFGLTGSSLSGLRSPDRIDTPRNVLVITGSVGLASLPPEQMAVLQTQLKSAGLTSGTYRPTGELDDDTISALQGLKSISATRGAADLDTLRSMIEIGETADQFSADEPSRTRNVTVSNPMLTDPLTARSTLRDVMRDRLGRAPTADEYHQFRTLLSNEESGQDVVTTVTSADGQGNTRTRVKRSDQDTDPAPSDVADDFSRRGKLGREANTHVAATDYFAVIDRLTGG